MINVRNAGTADNISSISIFAKFFAINTPTKISAGAVAQLGIMLASGLKNKQTAKQIDVITLERPVLPPAPTPDADSTNVVHVDAPSKAPETVPIESQSIDLFIFIGSPFSSSIPACDAVPYIVPSVSNISTRQYAIIIMTAENAPPTYELLNAASHAFSLNNPNKPISEKSLKDSPVPAARWAALSPRRWRLL